MSGMKRSIVAGSLALAAMTAMAADSSERVQVGQEAPEVALPGLGDETHTLSALRGEKNTVLVFYRGAW